jgi:hypothetical protein
VLTFFCGPRDRISATSWSSMSSSSTSSRSASSRLCLRQEN